MTVPGAEQPERHTLGHPVQISLSHVCFSSLGDIYGLVIIYSEHQPGIMTITLDSNISDKAGIQNSDSSLLKPCYIIAGDDGLFVVIEILIWNIT